MEKGNTDTRANSRQEDRSETELPNAETREAIDEVRRMKANPALGKAYTDIDAMMKELLG